jgi:hypothetical protein
MFNVRTYLWCVVGIVISVLLPIIWEAVSRYFPRSQSAGPAMAVPPVVVAFWRVTMPYLLLGAASSLTALLIVAALGDTLKDYRAALLAGYAWDSTLQKLRK